MTRADGQFPETRWSAVQASVDADEGRRRDGFARIAGSYWRTVYVYLRLHHRRNAEDASDLTQGFFEHWWTSMLAARFDPKLARFRTFVRSCLDHYVANIARAASTQKRGGRDQHVPIDTADLERDVQLADPSVSADPERLFEAEWARTLLEQSLEALREVYRASNRIADVEMFERYALPEGDRPTYEALARDYNLPVTTVTNRLAGARRELKSLILTRLREITMTEDEYRSEADRLLGVQLP